MESGMQDMLDSIGTLFYAAQAGKNFIGLPDIVDDGTSVTTYGGLARATYTTVCGTKTAAPGGVLTLTLMGTQHDSASVGAMKPTLGIANETVWGLYEHLLQPTVVANYQADGYPQVTRTGVASSRSALKGEIGFDALFFRGMPIAKDEKCTAQYLYMLNEKSIRWYGLKSHKYTNINLSASQFEDSPYADAPKSYGFVWTGLKEPVNQYAEIGQLMLLGNLVGTNPRLNSLLTGVTSS
jgi:hypothetical protein